MNQDKIVIKKRDISLIERADLVAKFREIYKRYYSSNVELTNQDYQNYINNLDLNSKNDRINLTNSVIVNLYEYLAKFYATYDIALPFEDGMSVMYEIAYNHILKKDNFPRYISSLLSEIEWIAINKLKIKDIKYRLHNSDVNYEDIYRDVDQIVSNKSEDEYSKVYQNELYEIFKGQISDMCNRHIRPGAGLILLKYFGFLDKDESKTYEQLAKEFGIPVDQIRNLLLKSMKGLRHPRYVKNTKDFLYD